MKSKIIDEYLLRELYIDKKMSLRKISQELGRPVSTVVNYMNKYGIERRTKSQAQASYLENNEHPMSGKKHSEESKMLISESLGSFWDNLSEEEREFYKEKVGAGWRNKWQAMSDKERQNMLDNLNAANRASQGNGSRFERFVAEELRNRGFMVEERSQHYIPNAKFEVDIMLLKDGIAIEIDGPSHYLPIYGEETLQKQQERDAKKDKYLTSVGGFHVLRVRDSNGPLSQVRINRIVEKIMEIKKNGKPKVWTFE